MGALALGELCQALEAAARARDDAACRSLVQQLPATWAAATRAIEQHQVAAAAAVESGTADPS